METKDIHLFVFDTKENFAKSKSNLGLEGSAFKKITCVENAREFNDEFQLVQDDDLVFMVVHVFYTDHINGIKRFVASRIQKQYPNLGFMYISEGDSKEINKQMIDADLPTATVYKYHQVLSNLEDNIFSVHSKKDIIKLSNSNLNAPAPIRRQTEAGDNKYPRCDYAIITALEEDEMEKILPMIEKEGGTSNSKHLIEYGHVKNKPAKKIAYASQQATGMVDAAILATELLITFRPKFLIMPGVLGGKPNEAKIGDIILSTKVFTVDKGKLTTEGMSIDEPVEKQPNTVGHEKAEKVFKKEMEAVTLSSSAITKIIRNRVEILNYINNEDQTRRASVNLLCGPIACVRQVIDQEGYFEKYVLEFDRKAIGLEMESYGIARACELVNNGETTPIIVKSVMDNTADKVDEAKTYAAWVSGTFVRYILENDLI
jgi:nucleoside phosphorylase